MPQSRRRRKTVCFDATLFQRRLDECVALALQRHAQGHGLRARGQVLPWLDGAHQNGALLDAGFVRQHLRALLKAFVDAARPASGLAIASDGLPQQLEGLLTAGQALSVSGAAGPKLERNIRAGAPVDLRLAEAALAFFRVFLERPGLRLDEIGAAQTDRVEQARQTALALPTLALDGLESMLRKAREMAGYAWVLDDYVVEYRGLRRLVDERGLPRIALERISRYKPVKLVDFECALRPCHVYEWYEWSRYASASLRLRLLDPRGRKRQEWTLALRKHLDEDSGFVRYDLAPDQTAPEALQLLDALARARPGQQALCELEWQEQMVLNAADRDHVVSYCPVTRLQLRVETAAQQRFVVSVGDSPGLVRRDGAWHLERALLPREVLAVRFRWAELTGQEARTVSPTGELLSRRGPPS
jgi:hypothetical protein